jgi:tetratricopeptide (TPR) repeat protein
MNKIILLIVIIFQSLNLLAQKAELTSAILSFRKQDMLTSKNYILKAEQKINEGGVLKVKDLSKLYYHKGLVFFNIYYSNIDNIDILDNLTNLDISYESFKKDVYLESSSYRDKSLIEIKRCSQSFNDLAYKAYESKDFSSATIFFEKVYSINSLDFFNYIDTMSLYNASVSAIQDSNHDKSISILEKLITIDSLNGDYYLNLIKEYTKISDTDKRFATISRGRSNVPQNTAIIFEEVNYYLEFNKNNELLEVLDIAIKADPNNKVLYFAKASTLTTEKKYEMARLAYEKSIEIDSNYFDAYNNLASLYLDQAVPIIEKMNNLGLSSSDQKQYDILKQKRNNLYKKAKPFLINAVRIDSSAIQVLKALKDVCYQTDDIDCFRDINRKIKDFN